MSDLHDEAPARLRRWLVPRLLDWYQQARRSLPWRRDRDPYRIWVSEVMLQQTTVATVIPRFEQFLSAFPTLSDLARAEEQTVLRQWEGLGYYRRARDLLRAAKQLATSHNSKIPDDPDLLAQLPGMGTYTRNAVLSQAFDRRLPILEANTQRVLSRLFGWADDPRGTAARRRLWQAAEDLLPHRGVGEFNQALMELGALVCTPRQPSCQGCPLAKRCVANSQGKQEEIPSRAPPAPPTLVREVALVVRRDERVLLVQRPGTGRWANMWEFPHGEVRADPVQEAVRLLRDLTGIEATLGGELTTITHGVTRYRITLGCFEANWSKGEFTGTFHIQGRWLAPGELGNYPVSSPQRKLAKLVGRGERRLF